MSSTRSPSLLLILLVTFITLSAVAPIWAQEAPYVVGPGHLSEPTVQELKYKTLADEAYSRGDLIETLRQLKLAYRLKKNPRYLANQGLVLADFGRYKEAVEFLERFLASHPPIPNKRAAEAEIAVLKPVVQITSEPPDVMIFNSSTQELLGRTPFKENLISGEHRITLKKEGYDPLRVSLFVSPGKPVIARYVLNSKLVLTGPPPPNAFSPAPSALGVSGALKPVQRSPLSGPKVLSIVSASAAILSACTYFVAREALIERDLSLTEASWARAQGESEAYYQVSIASASIASLSGLSALGWWLHSQGD